MAWHESRRTAELKALRAELEQRLEQLDFRSESLGPALAEMAQHAERTIRRLLTT
jgi:prefoldin subunit 5